MTSEIALSPEKIEELLQQYQHELSLNPDDPANHLNLSNVYIKLGNINPAIQHLHHALRLKPNYTAALNNLGRLFYKQGRFEEAIPYFEKVIRIDPNYWQAHYNLAHSLSSLNLMNQAAAHYEQVIRLTPKHAIAHFNLGLIYFEDSNFPLARQHLEITLEIDPNNIEATRILGQTYTQLGFIQEAILMYQKSINLSPNLAEVHHNLAILYLREEEHPKALAHFRSALSLDESNETAKHMIKALEQSNDVKTPPLEYVKQLFDQYAEYYDNHLKSILKYEVPGLLRNAIGRSLGPNPKAGRILDLGCGTGLTGIMFRDLALELIGVDLSPKMLEKAQQLDTYEKLVTSDLNSYLQESHQDYFDIIIAADVFVYCGALEKIFEEIARTLAPNGLFAFTIEVQNQTPLHLQSSGRFSHSNEYIQHLAELHHMSMLLQESISLREHQGIPVAGKLYVLKSCHETPV